ncbi:MAG TPA: hypothetical protein VFG39_01450 [Balneolaceae bacterium]|nr:hypothetical protein [Balneolaceae bacterium]
MFKKIGDFLLKVAIPFIISRINLDVEKVKTETGIFLHFVVGVVGIQLVKLAIGINSTDMGVYLRVRIETIDTTLVDKTFPLFTTGEKIEPAKALRLDTPIEPYLSNSLERKLEEWSREANQNLLETIKQNK